MTRFITTLPEVENEEDTGSEGEGFVDFLDKKKKGGESKPSAPVADFFSDLDMGFGLNVSDSTGLEQFGVRGDRLPAVHQKIKERLALKPKKKVEDDSEGEVEEVEEEEGKQQQDQIKPKRKEDPTPNGRAITVAPREKVALTKKFEDLGISRPLLRACADLKFLKPTAVQAHTIPLALQGRDCLVNAVTGSGKTAAFMLPTLERLLFRPRRVAMTRVLVITPTRELAAQVHQMTQGLAKHTDIRVALVVGGLSPQVQETELRSRPDIVVCTPGRIIDLLRNSQTVHLEDIEVLILDEADRLLELGFSDEVREVVSACPKQRQTMLFSATLTEKVDELVNLSLKDPQLVVVDPFYSIVDTLTQEFIRVRSTKDVDREAIVLALCKRTFHSKVIVFIESKIQTHRLTLIFGLAGLKAAELHGNLTQTQRLEALELFKAGAVDFLLATDLAARGLDIKGIETVINLGLPRKLSQYVHRVGRTARAGLSGRSVTLVGEEGRKLLKEIVSKVPGVKARVVPHQVVAKHRAIIESVEEDVEDIIQTEAMEKTTRVAEMEANKATNLINHENEIYARPAKTWFQTPKERELAKNSAEALFEAKHKQMMEEKEGGKKKKEDDGDDGDDDGDGDEGGKRGKKNKKGKKDTTEKKDPLRGLSRAKKRRKVMEMQAEKEKAAIARQIEAGKSVKSTDRTMTPKEAVASGQAAARKAKALRRKHGDIVESKKVVKQKEKSKKKKKASAGEGNADGGGGGGDDGGGDGGGGGGGEKRKKRSKKDGGKDGDGDGPAAKKKYITRDNTSETPANRFANKKTLKQFEKLNSEEKKKPKGKPHHSFKSKARFNRRK